MEQLTIYQYLSQVFGFGEDISDWKNWPPNTFAVTTDILKKTGCYRAVLHEKWLESFDGDGNLWQKIVEIEAQIWKRNITAHLFEKFGLQETFKVDSEAELQENIQRIFQKEGDPERRQRNRLNTHLQTICNQLKKLTFNELRLVNQENISDITHDLPAFINSILFVHAVCDEVCTGLGLSGAFSDETSFFNCVANTLLISSGSLSTFDKQICTVLPKMRTPQTGLTVRSFSHHLTCHSTEVEVIWRMIPWINYQENTINILSICWPNSIPNTFFLRESESFKSVNYFKYEGAAKTRLDPHDVISLIEEYKVNHGIERIHIIVFPELSLDNEEWEQLLTCLKHEYRNEHRKNGEKINQIPIVLAGVRESKPLKLSGTDVSTNELRIATYFSEKWYLISQRKHHRWSLNEAQIKQYGLAGRFSTAKRWYEKIEISQRRLSIMAPNGWLSICPLICEDLAQLEPVSELIRGIGPTLLITLLADGPQLDNRWSSRYASVFADDPGTSVLTLTSSGMVKKSSSRFVDKKLGDHRNDDDSNTVGLWKDMITGFHPIKDPGMGTSGEKQPNMSNFLLTVTAEWKEELTADGRTDHTNASVIKFQSLTNEQPRQREHTPPEGHLSHKEAINDIQDWTDIKELSLATVIIEMLITLKNKKVSERIVSNFLESSNTVKNLKNEDFYDNLFIQIITTSMDSKYAGTLTPESIGATTRKERISTKQKWPTASLHVVFWYLLRDFDKLLNDTDNIKNNIDNFYEYLYLHIKGQLHKIYAHELDFGADLKQIQAKYPGLLTDDDTTHDNLRRLYKACLLQILIILHNKLEHLRRKNQSGSKTHERLFPSQGYFSSSELKQKQLFIKVEGLLNEYGY